MGDILFQYYPVPPTTWVYLSSLLAIALYFKFGRLWCVRNFDLLGLILLAPGMLSVHYGQEAMLAGAGNADTLQKIGFIWLFVTCGLFLVRTLIDPLMVRRPLLEPNLSVGGLTFLCVSLLVFLLANVLTGTETPEIVERPFVAESPGDSQPAEPVELSSLDRHGPGFPLLFRLPAISTQTLPEQRGPQFAYNGESAAMGTARLLAILGHIAVVLGMITIGYRHFDNIKTGIAAATLYLMLPYAALLTGRVDHVLPVAFLIWAIESYRRPLVAGLLIGLAAGISYYPFFLLPLWLSFYWQRGLLRFGIGVVTVLLLLVALLAFRAPDGAALVADLRQMFGWRAPLTENVGGLWQYLVPVFRLPVLAAFTVMSASFAIWPLEKNLGTLMSCSAAVMLGTQFWHPSAGGTYMAWFLPLLLLTIFRPNLEDRVALTVLGEGWFTSLRNRHRPSDRAA